MATVISKNINSLEAAFNKAAADRNTVRILPPSPNGQGALRQAPSAPDSIPVNLPRGLTETGTPNLPIAPQQNIPTPSTASTVAKPNIFQSSINNSEIVNAGRYISNTPVAQSIGTFGNKTVNYYAPAAQNLSRNLSRAAGNAGNAIAAVQIAAQTTRNVTETLKNPSARNIANTGLDVAIPFLLALPNPYAKGLGALLLAGKSIYDIFNPIDNVSPTSSVNTLFNGGKGRGVQYYVTQFRPRLSGGANGASLDYGLQNSAALITGAITGFPCEIDATNSATWYVENEYGVRVTLFGVGAGSYKNISISDIKIERVDGQPDDTANDGSYTYEPNVNNDGFVLPNFDELTSRLDGIEAAINSRNLSDFQKDDILQAIRDALPKNNNGVTPRAENRTPTPLPVGSNRFVPANEPKPNATPAPSPASLPKSGTPTAPSSNNSVDKVKDKIKEIEKLSQTQSEAASKPVTKPDTSNRFKDPKDCNFSCENLAKCFVDLKVNIFDGCDPTNGTAKTKEITIQVLPKDKAKTQASFQELLDIRSRECSLNDRVLTVPDYWQVRLGQRPQAAILYREFIDGRFTDSYYTLHIPNYNGNRNTKPKLTQYSKGEHSAIYVCKDNSKLTVYAASDAEAKRVLNELEKFINPRLRGDIVHTGTRKDIKKTTVKPIRLDFYSTGQTKLSPDWSIAL